MKANSYILLNDATDAGNPEHRRRPARLPVEVSICEDGTSQTAPFTVPVLDGTIAEYKEYLPGRQRRRRPEPPRRTPPTPAGGGGH